MFSQTTEYALRAVVHLAAEAPHARTTKQIAAVTQVPQAYLSKVLQGLREAGIVHSQRGIGGGVSLVNPPECISLLDVVNAVDPIQRIRSCPIGTPTSDQQLCSLHSRLDQAIAYVENSFRNTTVAEILSDTNHCRPLCEQTDSSNSDAPAIVLDA